MDEDREPIDISEEVAALSKERHVIAAQRALNKLGVPYTLDGDQITVDDDDFDPEDEFIDAFAHELKMLVLADTFEDLEELGLVEKAEINEDGEIMWNVIGDIDDLEDLGRFSDDG